MTKKQKNILGISLIALPIPLLVATLASYAITSFAFSALAMEGTDVLMYAQIVRMALGLTGVLSIAGIILGIPIGVYILVKNK
ncbi:MAG: hypothetical protein Q8P30_04495 [Candidatus Uhrbacteria bacterium]|nr:hypothetical protein [Candidatus Uhrbacteria bacterium]